MITTDDLEAFKSVIDKLFDLDTYIRRVEVGDIKVEFGDEKPQVVERVDDDGVDITGWSPPVVEHNESSDELRKPDFNEPYFKLPNR